MPEKKLELPPLPMVEHIKLLPVDELLPYARNSRTHSEKQVKKLKRSIERFGFLVPVLIRPDGVIIAGHGRVLAAKRAKLTHVPVITADHLTDEECRAYVIADNKLALDAGWDEPVLAQELMDLQSLNFDLELTGFNEKEIAALLDDFGQGYEPEGGMPDASGTEDDPCVSQLGMVWDLGGHLLEVGELDRLFADQLVIHWQKSTSRDARLRDDGRTFAEVRQGVGRDGTRG
jgi:ParB-like chromosome segregation protein Spo0J